MLQVLQPQKTLESRVAALLLLGPLSRYFCSDLMGPGEIDHLKLMQQVLGCIRVAAMQQ